MWGSLSLLRALVAEKLILQKWKSPAVLEVIYWDLEVSDLSHQAKVFFKFKDKISNIEL